MIEAWRLVKQKRAAEAFAGEGARLFGGRWNHPGTRMVYLGGSLALAALETFVHIERAEMSIKFAAIRVEIATELIHALKETDLPKDWRQQPPPQSTKTLGSHWAEHRESAVLEVPSVVVPAEKNYLLNPDHPEFNDIVIGEQTPFQFDFRMAKLTS